VLTDAGESSIRERLNLGFDGTGVQERVNRARAEPARQPDRKYSQRMHFADGSKVERSGMVNDSEAAPFPERLSLKMRIRW
jgi:hypothetical protein